MKTRQGFISNSSSSSFIIHWDIKDDSFEEKENIKRAVLAILDADSYGRYCSKEYDANVESEEGLSLDQKILLLANHITQNTKYTEGKGYETIFWTSMTNDFRDYGEEAMEFLTALSCFGFLSDNDVLDFDYETEFD
jgi:hypothetical protein